jgi:hypothetical protein
VQADLLTSVVRVKAAEIERLDWIAKGFPWYAQDPRYPLYFPADKESGDITPSVPKKVSKPDLFPKISAKKLGVKHLLLGVDGFPD